MKHSVSFMIAIVTMAIFGSSAYAQTPDWLEGKWLGDGIYDIEGNVIKKTEDGITFNLGEFTIDEGNAIIINGKESGLIVLNDDEAIAFSTNPNYKFKKYDNITFPEDYKWVIGSWTDGNYIVTFTEKEVSVKQGEAVVNKGIYYIDETTDEYAIKYTSLNIYWDKSDGDGLVLNGNTIAYEGGDNLIKLPEQAGQSEAASSNPISLLTTSSQPYKGNLKWLYGTWVKDGTEIYITPKYYQARRENDSYLAGKELSELEKTEYVVIEEENQILGKVIRLDEFYLDPTSKLLYTLSGVDQKSYMEKTSNYVSPVIRYGKWVLIGLIAIAALIALTIIVVRLVKKAAKKAKEKAAAAKIVAEQKRAELSEKAKALKLKTSQITEQALDKTSQMASQIKSEASLGIRNAALISLLILLLLDFSLGIIFLFLTIVLFVIKIINKGLAAKILNSLSNSVETLNNKPEWWLILIGILMFREFNAVLGIVITIIGLFYLFTKKDSIRKQSFYSTFKKIVDDTKANHSCILFWGIVLTAFFILNIFFSGIIFYIAIAILVVFLVNFCRPSAFDKAKVSISKIYEIATQPASYKKLEKILQSKAKYAIYAIIGLVVIFNTQKASVVNTIPFLFENGGTEIEVNRTEAAPAPSTIDNSDNSNKSDVELAREEIQELNKQRTILTAKLVATFDPDERERIDATIKAIDDRFEYLSDYLIRKTGFPF